VGKGRVEVKGYEVGGNISMPPPLYLIPDGIPSR
jgi:hypothetical protein